jgi:hypothetical protein
LNHRFGILTFADLTPSTALSDLLDLLSNSTPLQLCQFFATASQALLKATEQSLAKATEYTERIDVHAAYVAELEARSQLLTALDPVKYSPVPKP